jgi:hypothetical protein
MTLSSGQRRHFVPLSPWNKRTSAVGVDSNGYVNFETNLLKKSYNNSLHRMCGTDPVIFKKKKKKKKKLIVTKGNDHFFFFGTILLFFLFALLFIHFILARAIPFFSSARSGRISNNTKSPCGRTCYVVSGSVERVRTVVGDGWTSRVTLSIL